MSVIDELLDEIEELEDAVDSITGQIEMSDARGDVDQVWRAKAKIALRHRNRDLLRARAELVEARKEARTNSHFYLMFHMQARKYITTGQFEAIEAVAREVIANASKG